MTQGSSKMEESAEASSNPSADGDAAASVLMLCAASNEMGKAYLEAAREISNAMLEAVARQQKAQQDALAETAKACRDILAASMNGNPRG